jgi:putative DNA primase/helicase
VNDITIEKLQVLMAENPNGMLFFRDELTGLFKAMDKPGHETDRKFFLECWVGLNPYRVERMGRPDALIERACLAKFGTIQPGPLSRYLKGSISGEDADGHMARFQVMVYPDPPIKFIYVDRYPDSVAKNKAFDVFRAIDTLDFAALGCEVDEDHKIPFIGFSDEAQDFFVDWLIGLETKLRSGTLSNVMTCHLSKYRSLMPSLSLIFHLVDVATEPNLKRLLPVSLDATMQAAAWCELLEYHAGRIYQAASDGDLSDAIRLAEKIKQSLPNPFTYRQVALKGWAGLDTVEKVRNASGILEDHDWVKAVEVPTTIRGGRPSENVWVSPQIADASPGVDP